MGATRRHCVRAKKTRGCSGEGARWSMETCGCDGKALSRGRGRGHEGDGKGRGKMKRNGGQNDEKRRAGIMPGMKDSTCERKEYMMNTGFALDEKKTRRVLSNRKTE